MDWREHIHSDPAILNGKPVFVGSRYAVERVLKLVGAGWTNDQIGQEYAGITELHVRAAALFAVDLMRDDSYVAIGQARAA
jgi:uncharacterized protein (DUF433 family)